LFETENKRKVTYLALSVAGAVLALYSSRTWIKISFVDYHGTDDWYGAFSRVVGLLTIGLGIFFVATHGEASFIFKIYRRVCIVANVLSIFLFSIVALRISQISAEITRKANAPADALEGTFLEGIGKIIANITGTIANLAKPHLARGWYLCLAASISGAVFCALAEFLGDSESPTEDETILES